MKKVAVIGQGYVGLPLAIELAYHFLVVGFDINEERVRELTDGIDRTQEADIEKLKAALIGNPILETSTLDGASVQQFNNAPESAGLSFSSDIADIRDAQIF